MGRMMAMDLAESAKQGLGSLRLNLAVHLQSNHYPPIPLSMIPVALRAIAYAKKEQWHKRVLLPKGITWRKLRLAPVPNVIQDLHLEEFINV